MEVLYGLGSGSNCVLSESTEHNSRADLVSVMGGFYDFYLPIVPDHPLCLFLHIHACKHTNLQTPSLEK